MKADIKPLPAEQQVYENQLNTLFINELNKKLPYLNEKSVDLANLPAVIAEPLSQASNVAT